MLPAILSALVASTSSSSVPARQEIIIIGRAISDKKDALAACLARNCPPDEDIDASLALAETQLVDGKYHDARKTLLAALKRNKDEAKAYPIPVSDLYRANGKVAASLGFDRDYYNSTWGIFRTLKYGLPSEKDRQYSAMMEIAEMMYRTRDHERARVYYDKLIAAAKSDGRPDIAALAELRMTIRHMPPYLREQEIRRILANIDPKLRAPVLEGTLALARMAYAEHDEAKADALVRKLAYLRIRRPILIYAPEYRLNVQDDQSFGQVNQDPPPNYYLAGGGTSSIGGNSGAPPGLKTGVGAGAIGMSRIALNTEDMWVDVTFRVTPDGRVADLKVARTRGGTQWAKPLLTSIAGRRYTPTPMGSPAALRRERYTYTSGVETGASSHLTLHSPNTRVEYMDLSDLAAAE